MAHAVRQALQLQPLALGHVGRAAQPGAGLVDALGAAVNGAVNGILQARLHQLSYALQRAALGGAELGGGGGRGGSQVGDKIGDRKVGFVAHTADHRHRAGGNSTGQLGIIKGPQVFHAATAAHQQDYVNHIGVIGPWPAVLLGFVWQEPRLVTLSTCQLWF